MYTRLAMLVCSLGLVIYVAPYVFGAVSLLERVATSLPQ